MTEPVPADPMRTGRGSDQRTRAAPARAEPVSGPPARGALAGATVAVVGATGAVGEEVLRLLAEAGVPAARVRALASERSAGHALPYGAGALTVAPLEAHDWRGVDVAILAADAELSRRHAPRAVAAGGWVVDNSSAFRMDPDVPLVVPEINAGALGPALRRPAIVANPNCTTILVLMAVAPLHRALRVERLVVASYQAVSGAGRAAMDELDAQSAEVLAGRPARPAVFAEPCAFNVFSHDSAVDVATGRNAEEEKLVRETAKILGAGAPRVAATCVRVPVRRAHCAAINVTLAAPAREDEVRALLAAAPGVRVIDDRAANRFPTSLKATGRTEVLVGRIRPDPSLGGSAEEGWRGFDLFVAGDQLLKGAAYNAVQIAELVLERRAGG